MTDYLAGMERPPRALPQVLRDAHAEGDAPRTADDVREALVVLGHCRAAHPAVTLELYGGLRVRSGCAQVPLHADTVRTAVAVLRSVCPKLDRLLPAEPDLCEHYRFSLNGRSVLSDLGYRLHEGDRVIVFSASVGG